MSLGAPLALLAVPALLAAFAAALGVRRRRAPGTPFPDTDLVARAAPRLRARRRLPLLAAAAGLALLGLAAARPSLPAGPPSGPGANVVLAIDVSMSMGQTDVAPSRLRAAQLAAVRFGERASAASRIGLVSFSSHATLLLLPTRRRAPLWGAIGGLTPNGTTAIGDAVLASLAALRERGSPRGASVIVLSDGENVLGATPREAARAARRQGVVVDTVALSAAPGGPRAAGGGDGGIDTLRRLAAATGGRAFVRTDAASLGRLYASLAGTTVAGPPARDLTGWTLAAGAAVLALAALGGPAGRAGARGAPLRSRR